MSHENSLRVALEVLTFVPDSKPDADPDPPSFPCSLCISDFSLPVDVPCSIVSSKACSESGTSRLCATQCEGFKAALSLGLHLPTLGRDPMISWRPDTWLEGKIR